MVPPQLSGNIQQRNYSSPLLSAISVATVNRGLEATILTYGQEVNSSLMLCHDACAIQLTSQHIGILSSDIIILRRVTTAQDILRE